MVSIPIGRWKDWLEDYFSLFCFDEGKKEKNKKIKIQKNSHTRTRYRRYLNFSFQVEQVRDICVYVSGDTLR